MFYFGLIVIFVDNISIFVKNILLLIGLILFSSNVRVSGGKGPYTISWDNGETGEKAEALVPGIHKVSITDSNGCTAEAEVIIVKSAIYAIWDKQDNACAGDCKGEITISIQNEDGSEKIDWSDGETGLIRTNLCAGTDQWKKTGKSKLKM